VGDGLGPDDQVSGDQLQQVSDFLYRQRDYFFTFTEFLMFIPITSEYMIGSVLWTMLKSEKTS
jgi:hypothetical protein